jgi:import inner membrane translocase subunit TIM23
VRLSTQLSSQLRQFDLAAQKRKRPGSANFAKTLLPHLRHRDRARTPTHPSHTPLRAQRAITMLSRSALRPARAFANRYPPAILAPLSTATASFSTCTRASKAQQPQSSSILTSRRAFPSKSSIIVRYASTAPSQSTSGIPPTSQPKLTWNDFFALRRTRRRIGQGCSVVGAVAVTYYGLTTMMTNGYDASLSAQLGGLDPFMLMGLSTFGMMAAGWLIGPIFGNQVFNLAYRGVLAEFTAVCHV